jgi:glycine cleavage system regulatory protein
MARLGGRFAGMLKVTVPDGAIDALTSALSRLEGLRVVVEEADASADVKGDVRAVSMELVGNDRPGIVREISSLLAARGVNVEELETLVEEAPMAGGALFRMRAQLTAPKTVTMDELRRAVEAAGHDLMVEVKLVEE